MAKTPPVFVIRPYRPKRRRRLRWLVVGATSLIMALALIMVLLPRGTHQDERAAGQALQRENELKSHIAIIERSEQVAKAAIADLQQTLRERDEEIAGLRTDLGFYNRLVGGARREGLAVHHLHITPLANSASDPQPINSPQAWNFSATLTQNLKKSQISSGRLKLHIEGVQAGRLETLNWTRLTQDPENAGIDYGFKYFQQIKGTIMLPDGFAPNRVHIEATGNDTRVEQDFSWDEALRGEETK